MREKYTRAPQGRGGRVELKTSAQTCLHELEELLTLEKQQGVVHFPTQPGIKTQLARPFELGFRAMADIQVKVGGQFDKFTPVLRLVRMDKDNVDIRRAAQHRIRLRGDKRASKIRGDNAAVVKSAFLRGFFGDSDQ